MAPDKEAVPPRPLRKPAWLRVQAGHGAAFGATQRIVRGQRLHTVCEEALCPNRGRCWEHGRATIMILGGTCSRACRFCNVTHARPEGCDPDEPRRVAEAVRAMGLRDVVLTSVTRDDLPDGGAALWAETIRAVRRAAPGCRVEVLVPDFSGSEAALGALIGTRPAVFGHNLETVRGLYPTVRPGADYARSLGVLRATARAGLIAKTGIMVGLGETAGEVAALMRDAREAGVDIFTAGQYLQPSRQHLPVSRYVEPAEFEEYRRRGLELGFGAVVSGPLVRSSFHSDEQVAYVARRLGAEA